MKTIKTFIKEDLDGVLRNVLQQASTKINSETEAYLLNVNEEDYISHLVSEFTLELPIIDFEGITASSIEKMIPARDHPSAGFFFFEGDEYKEYKRQVVTFHLPFSGDVNLLEFAPNPRLVWTIDLIYESSSSEGESLTFEIVNFNQDAEVVKREKDQILGNLRTQVGHITNQINGHNNGLKTEIERLFHERKNDLMSKSDFLSQLGVPIKKKENLPETFAVSTARPPKKIVPKPSVSTIDGKIDPTLELDVYEEILQVMHDLGKAIERMPATYEGKTEEQMRDHFLMYLEPRFEGSATGETFNKSGKTDILLRYQNSNVFVAECKYWSGEKHYLDTIGQILGYLTWRDSKAAIILFVKNLDFSSVIEAVKTTTPKHKNFVSFDGGKEDTWITYKIYLNGDPNRKVFLTILLFHYPERT